MNDLKFEAVDASRLSLLRGKNTGNFSFSRRSSGNSGEF
jgi:hypothetical protein